MSFDLYISTLEWNLDVIEDCSSKVSAQFWEAAKDGKVSIEKY